MAARLPAKPSRQADSNGSARLFRELNEALRHTSAEEIKAWGQASIKRLPVIGRRRIRNLGHLVASLAKGAGTEVKAAFDRSREGRLKMHLQQRTAVGIDKTIELAQQIGRGTKAIAHALQNDPRKNAPGLLALALGFIAGSGGVDADGGVADTDIAMFGIGDHRSLFTHSIIAGIVVEGAILAVADLAGIVCSKLSEGQRAPFWDTLESGKDQIAQQLATGASIGLAYHLAVDATLQRAAYKDLPVSMPMEAHQFLFAVNAAAEGYDAAARPKTTGEKIVGSVSSGLGYMANGVRALLSSRG